MPPDRVPGALRKVEAAAEQLRRAKETLDISIRVAHQDGCSVRQIMKAGKIRSTSFVHRRTRPT